MANVVSSAVTAGLMDKAQLHNITDPLERFSQKGGFLTDFTNGLAGAAIGYGVSKGLYNEGSWNFKNVATDAFGNALGNSIVSSMMPATPQQAEKKAKAAAQQAVQNGASPQEARAIELQTYARESGGTVEAVAVSGGKTGRGSFAYDSDDGFWLSNGSDRALIGYGASMNDVSNFLGNSAARDLGMQYASSRLVAKQARDDAFYDGVVSGHAKVRTDAIRRAEQAQTLNLNDPRTQALMVNSAVSQYRDNFFNTGLKGLELASYAVGGAGLLLGGARLAGRGAMELAKSGFRGSFIHGSSKTAAVWGATKGGAQLYTGYQVADAGLGMLTDPGGTAAAVRQGIQTGQHIYHEGVRNGGFKYATGVTGELDVGTKVNLALGGYLSVDLKTMDFNYGFYGTGELGSKLGLPNPTASLGWEHTVFTTSKYKDALVGKYSIHGAGGNYRNTGRALTGAYISAAGGAISGYQFTSERKNTSIKTGFSRDPQAYTNFGYGAIYDAQKGEFVWE